MDKKNAKTITLRESIVEESRNTIDAFMLDGKTLGDFIESLPKCNRVTHGRYKSQMNLDKNLFDFFNDPHEKTTNNNKSTVLEEKDHENSDDSQDHPEDNDNDKDNMEPSSPKSLLSAAKEEEQQEENLSQLQATLDQDPPEVHKPSLPAYLESITYLENQFVLENWEATAKAEIDKMNPPTKPLTINSFDIVNNESKEELFNAIKSSTKLKISAMCSVGDDMFLGAENGLVYKYSLKDSKELCVFKTKELASNSILWCIDSNTGKYIVTGFSNGTVNLIHSLKQKSLGIIKNITKSGIMTIRMILAKKQRLTFIACDFTGIIYKVKVKINLLLKHEIRIDKIYDNSVPIYHVVFMRYNKEQFIAFSTLELTKVLKVKPEGKELALIPRDKNAKERFLFDFCFGLGEVTKERGVTNSNDKLINLFCLANESFIVLYSFEIENSSITGMNQIGEYNTNSIIIKLGFLSPSLIYFIDEFFKMKMVNTIDFASKKTGSYKEDEIKHNIIYLNHMSILSLNIFTDLKNRINKATYFNFILSTEKGVLLLGKNMLSLISLKSSEQCLSDLIKFQDWDNAIELASNVFSDCNALWPSDSLSQVKEKVVNSLVFKYMEYVIHLNRPFNDTSVPKESLLVQSFEFCIRVNMFNSIISKLFPLFMSNNEAYLFFNALQPYVFLNHFNVKHIESDFIKELIKNYANKKQLLTSLLFHFDRECLEADDVFNVIKENKLINTVIYILTNKSKRSSNDVDDYFLPIEILVEMLNGLHQKLDCAMSPLQYSLSNIDLFSDDFFYSKPYLTYKIYWYCCLVLDNQAYETKQALAEDKLNHFVIHISLWLISDNILHTLISFEPFSYFKVWRKLLMKEEYLALFKAQSVADFKEIMRELKLNTLKQFSPINFIGMLEKKVDELNDAETFKAFYDLILYMAKDNCAKLSNELLIKAGKYLIAYEIKKKTEDSEIFQENVVKMLKEISQFSHEDLMSLLNCFTENFQFDSIKQFLSSLMTSE